LAKDYYLKINPKVNSEKVFMSGSDGYNYTITNDTFLFAMDTPDYYIDSKLYKFSLNFVKNDYNLSVTNINLITCDKVNYSNIFEHHSGAKTFKCFDLSEILNENLTTLVEEYSYNYFEFFIEYDNDYIVSLNETNKNEILNSEEIIYFYYPRLFISPNNYLNPLDIHLGFDSITIYKNMKYIYIMKYIVTNLEENDNFVFDSFSVFDSEIHFVDKEIRIIPRVNESDYLTKFIISLDGSYYDKYTRVYKKISDILPQVFGIMQPIMILFSFLIQYFTKYNLDKFLVNNFLFFFNKQHYKDDKIIWKHNNFKDFKNLFKNITNNQDNKESEIIKTFSKININENFNERISESALLPIKKQEQILIQKNIDNSSNRPLSYEDKILQCKNDSIYEINLEMVDIINENNNKILQKESESAKSLNTIGFLNNDGCKREEKKKKLFDLFNSTLKIRNKFPYIGFKDYYFAFFIPKNKKLSNLRLNYTKILKYFSKEIMQKLDLFYYLKLVRTVEILKNTFLRKKVEKESLRFLVNSLYFLRDCDIDFIAHEIDKESN